jgi:hypothetical protein
MLNRMWFAFLIAMCVSSCGVSGPVRQIDTACDWVRPILIAPSEVDTLTDDTARQILAHNEAFEAACETDS